MGIQIVGSTDTVTTTTSGGTVKVTPASVNATGVSTFSDIRITGGTISGVSTAGITTAYINNLGIGTATVSQPLYVVGNAKVTATLSSNNLAFHAEATSGTSLSANALTKVNITSESFDVANCYDATNSRYTPNVAGWYFFRANVRADIASNAVLHVYFTKNNTTEFGIGNFISVTSSQAATVGTAVGFFNGTTDYVEVKVYSGSAGTTMSGKDVAFSGFLLSPTAF